MSQLNQTPPLIIAFEGDLRQVTPQESCTFGRAADLVIDPSNRLLHRVLGRFYVQDRQWWLANEGRSTPLVITDEDSASYTRVVASTSTPVPFQRCAVSFSVGRANYRIGVENAGLEASVPGGALAINLAEPTLTTGALVFNQEQFALLEALAQPRLDGPITAADLPSNRALAADLGWTITKFNRKLDNLCTKLTKAGVVGLQGSVAEVAHDRRLVLANFVVEHGIVTETTSAP